MLTQYQSSGEKPEILAVSPDRTKNRRTCPFAQYQEREALKRRVDGETLADIACTYNVSLAPIPRLDLLRGYLMATSLQKQKFLAKLEALSKGQPFNSRALREAIGWKGDAYDRVRTALAEAGLIKLAKGGPGGTVQLLRHSSTNPRSLFISYSHEDEEMKNNLVKHLAPLTRRGLISSWHDRKILAGEDWNHVISSHLASASIVLLLVSIDFINSEYCYDTEMMAALRRHAEKKCLVIPIIMRSCLWQMAPFAKLQALPKDAQAVSSWPDKEDAFVDIVMGIKLAAEKQMQMEGK